MRPSITLAALASAALMGCDRGERQSQDAVRAGKSVLGHGRYEPVCVTNLRDGFLVTYALETDSLVQVMDESLRAIVFVAVSGEVRELRASLDSVATRPPEHDADTPGRGPVEEQALEDVRVHCTQGLVGGMRIDIVSSHSRELGPEVESLFIQADPWRIASSIWFR